MKRTAVLYAQHIGRMIKYHWFLQGKLKVLPTGAAERLQINGFDVIDAENLLRPPLPKEKIEFVGFKDKELPLDENHPNYQVEPCFIYRDDDVLVQGLDQSKVLTNTVEISDCFPKNVIEVESKLSLPDEIHSEVRRKILLSCIFEATQHKLPKRIDPSRPAHNLPRDYGMPDFRKNELLCKNLVGVCEQFSSSQDKAVVSDAFFSTPVKAHNKKIQFELTSELVVTSGQRLSAMAKQDSTISFTLPNLFPVDCTISLKPCNFYKMQDIYPFSMNSKWPFIQTAIVHYNHTQVKNIFEEEVMESQIYARSLLKGFSIAVGHARAIYGNIITQLPHPVVVPVVQVDGRMFHFTIFQLNTLELDQKSEIKNIFWNSPRIPLYEACEYKAGRPVLQGYNADVIKKLITFYNMN